MGEDATTGGPVIAGRTSSINMFAWAHHVFVGHLPCSYHKDSSDHGVIVLTLNTGSLLFKHFDQYVLSIVL